MLEYNNGHKSLTEPMEKKSGFKNIIGGLSVAFKYVMSGFARNVPCDIEDNHAHKYTDVNSFVKYIKSEREVVGSFVRTEQYIPLSEESEKTIDFENKNKLLYIRDNEEVIRTTAANLIDYEEYEYEYTEQYLVPMPVGKMILPQTRTRTAYSWTTDKEENLTGETRVVHHVFQGYNIGKTEDGKLKIIEGDPVDTVDDLIYTYDYFKPNFYSKVYFNDKTLEEKSEDRVEENIDEEFGRTLN